MAIPRTITIPNALFFVIIVSISWFLFIFWTSLPLRSSLSLNAPLRSSLSLKAPPRPSLSLRTPLLDVNRGVSSLDISPDFVDHHSNVSREISIEKVLKDASMNDNTVILTTLNEAWAAPNSIADLFFESFRVGLGTVKLLNYLVIIALDAKAYRRCLDIHKHCFFLKIEGVDFHQEAFFMTPDYLKMMWIRIDFLRSVLKMGYNFVFTDIDILWFRDPFLKFDPDADFQVACDHFFGSSYSLHNRVNGGFMYVKSNNRTIWFYDYWYRAHKIYTGMHDQDVLNIIKFDNDVRKSGLKILFLDTSFFGGLCEPSRNLNLVCTMHANCCFGLRSKIHDLQLMLEDWKLFLKLPPPWKSSPQITWRVPDNCSLAALP